MKIDRKYVQQLAEVKARHPKGSSRMPAFGERMTAIDELLEHAKSCQDKDNPLFVAEIYRYIPIGAIALLQGYLATVIRDVVDGDSERCARASQAFREVTVRLDSLIDINQHSMTIGDIAASAISINSVEAMLAVLTDLLGEDAKSAIGRQTLSGQSTYASIMDTLLAGIADAFRWRHMFCHELATTEFITFDQADGQFSDVVVFIIGVERAVNDLLRAKASSNNTPEGVRHPIPNHKNVNVREQR